MQIHSFNPCSTPCSPCLRGYLLVHLIALFVAPSCLALSAPLVIPVEGQPFPAKLESIDATGRITFRMDDTSRVLAMDDLVRWSHPALPRRQTLVVLEDGSRLVTAAEWSGGAAVRLDGDQLVVLSDTWGEIRLPKRRVRGLVFAHRGRPQDRLQLERQVLAADGPRDQVLLTNEDRVGGTIVRLSGGSLAIATEAGEAELPLSRVEAVVFGKRNEPSPNPSLQGRGNIIVGLRDGSLLAADAIRTDDANLEIELPGGLQFKGGTRDEVVALESLGGRFVYLSDLEPADYRHVPYLNITWPYKRDRNLLGEPLTVGGRIFLKGIAMHSAGRLTYKLDAAYRRFQAEVAIDDSAGDRGSVVFGVHVLRDGRWQEAFKSGTVRGGDEPQFVFVDFRGAQALTLTVDYADRGDELDHADWLDARLVK